MPFDSLDRARRQGGRIESHGRAGCGGAQGATATRTAAAIRDPRVADDTEFALREILPVKIKIDRVLTGKEGAARRIAHSSGERYPLLRPIHGLHIVDAAERAAVR